MVIFRPTALDRRKSGARLPTRKLVRRQPTQRCKRTKAETEILKVRNKETRELINRLLEEERAKIWDRADELHREHGLHTRQWWHDSIVQVSTKPRRATKLTRWRAWVSKRVREMNDENRRKGEPIVKPGEVSKQLSADWKKLSDIEKAAAVDEYIEEFEAQRDEATTSVQNVGLKAFHDIRAQIQKWEQEADALHARTSVEVVFTVVRTDFGQYNKPYTWATSSRADDFFNHVYKSDLTQTALRLESYMLSGIGGVTQNYIQSFTELKSATAKLIHDKLNEAVGHPVSGMKYTNFHKYITIPHHLIIKGWPLSKFASPSDIGSKSDCEVLRAAWTSGACRFEKLDDAEYLKLCVAMSTSPDDPEPRDQATDDHADPIDPPTSPSLSHNTTTPIADAPNASPFIHTTPSTPSFVPLQTDPTIIINIPTPASTQSLKRPADPFITVIGLNGNIINVAKKPRKTRSDKGMPRGPRKKAPTPTPLPSPSTASASSASPSLSATPSLPPADPNSILPTLSLP